MRSGCVNGGCINVSVAGQSELMLKWTLPPTKTFNCGYISCCVTKKRGAQLWLQYYAGGGLCTYSKNRAYIYVTTVFLSMTDFSNTKMWKTKTTQNNQADDKKCRRGQIISVVYF